MALTTFPIQQQALMQALQTTSPPQSQQQIADTRRKGENSPQAVKERAEAMARAQANSKK